MKDEELVEIMTARVEKEMEKYPGDDYKSFMDGYVAGALSVARVLAGVEK